MPLDHQNKPYLEPENAWWGSHVRLTWTTYDNLTAVARDDLASAKLLAELFARSRLTQQEV